MKFTRFEIPDVVLIEPRVFEDARGFFFESYHRDLFLQNGIDVAFVQDNHVRSQRGVLRGLHYQIPPRAQAKLLRVVSGAVFDVAVDIRRGSPTFGRHIGVTLRSEEKKMIFVPAGFAHGYLTLADPTEVLYKCSDIYSPPHERGILWKDPALGIRWPQLDREITVSEKDEKYPFLKQATDFPSS